MREPSAVIPVTASVDDDGLVHIEGDDLSLVRWNHRLALVRAALQHIRGRAGSVPPDDFLGILAKRSGVGEAAVVWVHRPGRDLPGARALR
jgi:hypothetical protein